MSLTLFSKPNCPKCDQAKAILDANDISYVVSRIDQRPDARDFLIAQGHKSLPQFYSGSHYLGDFESFIKPFLNKKR